MIDSIRPHAFRLSVVAAVAVIIGSCIHTYRALDDLPLVQRQMASLEEKLFRLHRLFGTVGSSASRLQNLALGGDQFEHQQLVESLARGEDLVKDLLEADDVDQMKPLLIECLEHFEEVRLLASDVTDIELQERTDLREQTTDLRSRLETATDHHKSQLSRLRDLSERERRGAVATLFGGHAILLVVIGLLYFARNAERRLRQQADLRTLEADERFALVVRGSADGILLTDRAGRIEMTNQALEKMFRASEQDLQGKPVGALFTTTVIDEWLTDRTRERKQQKSLSRSVTARRSDGTRFSAELIITPRTVRDQEFLGISVRDVSERQASRMRLKQQEALLSEIPEALHILDSVGRVVYWNRGAERLYGYSASEVIGQTANDLLRIVLPNTDSDNTHSVRYSDAERWIGELRARTKDQRWLNVERRRTRVREGGEVIGEVIFDFDLGERKQMQQVERRRQRLESLGTLASGIAHDLNNLLTPILMSSRMLQRDSPNLDRSALVETIAASAGRGAELIAQLLTFARGGDGQHQTIETGLLMTEMVGIVQHTLPKDIALEVHVAENLPRINGDATEISQVIMNLAINGRDAMASGGTIGIVAKPLVLTAEQSFGSTTLQPGHYVSIAVSDTGSGIPPVIHDRIFDPFFTTKARGQGTGLGLSTSIGIVRSHGGALALRSAVGRGTTVTIILPADNAVMDKVEQEMKASA